jgi:hypothetical protein
MRFEVTHSALHDMTAKQMLSSRVTRQNASKTCKFASNLTSNLVQNDSVQKKFERVLKLSSATDAKHFYL